MISIFDLAAALLTLSRAVVEFADSQAQVIDGCGVGMYAAEIGKRYDARVEAFDIDKRVDTTGAGDLYASGFLYGYTAGYDLAACGRLGSMAAAEVITHMGARPVTPLHKLAPKVL